MKERIAYSASIKNDELTLVEYQDSNSSFWKVFLNREEIYKTSEMENGLFLIRQTFESLAAVQN